MFAVVSLLLVTSDCVMRRGGSILVRRMLSLLAHIAGAAFRRISPVQLRALLLYSV